MQAHEAVAHLPFQFGLGHQSGHGIHHHHVERAGRNQRAGNFQCLLAVIRLGYQQIIDIDPQPARVGGIQGVLSIDECRRAARGLRLRDHLEGDGGFAGGFRSENLHHASAWKSPHAQRGVQGDGAGGNNRYSLGVARAKLQHGAFPELLFHLNQRLLNQLAAVDR